MEATSVPMLRLNRAAGSAQGVAGDEIALRAGRGVELPEPAAVLVAEHVAAERVAIERTLEPPGAVADRAAYADEAPEALYFPRVCEAGYRGDFGMDRTDRETWELASMVVDKHGAGALSYAEARADEAADERDETGHAVWLAIAEAIRELHRAAATGDDVN